MAFNHKAQEISALTKANAILQRDKQENDAEKARLGPYFEVAQDLYDTVQRQAAQTEDPEIAYATAYDSVRQKLFEERREAVRKQIIAENQAVWEKEIDEEIIETQGEAIKAKARQDFLDNEAERYRQTAIPRISKEIARLTREELIAGFDEETKERLRHQAQEQALQKEEHQQRLEKIRDISLRHGQLDLGCLERGEVITIDFCTQGEAKDTMPRTRQDYYQPTSVKRTLKLTMLEPTSGVTLVLDDSWQKDEDDLRAEHAIEDNTQLTIGTLRQDDKDFVIDPTVHRGGLLYMMSPNQDVSHPFEVSRIWLQDDCIL